jgi:hypothetical protein
MGVQKPRLIVVLALLAVLATTSFAGAPMGPPIAVLSEGQWGIGAEYGYEEIDIEAYGTIAQNLGGPLATAAELLEIRDMTSNMIFGTLAYGVCDNWDLFVRAGVSDAQDDVVVRARSGGSPGETSVYDGGFGFAWGAGTRATFCRWGPWSFGGLVQATWFDPDDSDWSSTDPDVPTVTSVGTTELDYWQTQVSLSAVYQIDSIHLWVGPFLQFIEGDLEREGDVLDGGSPIGTFAGTSELEEASQIGVHAGANVQVARELDCWVEGQYTGDSWLAAVSVVLIPEQMMQGK